MESRFIALERLFWLHELIQQEQTGTPEECVDRLQICIYQLHKMIGLLTDHGAEIRYNPQRRTFSYYGLFQIPVARLIQLHLANHESGERDH